MNPGSTAELDEIARIRDAASMLLEAAEAAATSPYACVVCGTVPEGYHDVGCKLVAAIKAARGED